MITFLTLPLELRLEIYDCLRELDTIRVPNGPKQHHTPETGECEDTTQTKEMPHALQRTCRQLRDEFLNLRLPIRHLEFTVVQTEHQRNFDLEPLNLWLKHSPLEERARIQSIKISTPSYRCRAHDQKCQLCITLDINGVCKIVTKGLCDECYNGHISKPSVRLQVEVEKIFR